jgi:hypothetical protein
VTASRGEGTVDRADEPLCSASVPSIPRVILWVKCPLKAARFNLCPSEDRTHPGRPTLWSRVVEGEPPEEVGEVDWKAMEVAAETGVLSSGAQLSTGFSPKAPVRSPPSSGWPLKSGLTPREQRHKHPLQGRQEMVPGEVCLIPRLELHRRRPASLTGAISYSPRHDSQTRRFPKIESKRRHPDKHELSFVLPGSRSKAPGRKRLIYTKFPPSACRITLYAPVSFTYV